MSKFKIEIDLDIDFKKYFPESDEYFENEALCNVFNKIYVNAITNHIKWMANKDYDSAKHHLQIEEEISKQLFENFKITYYNYEKSKSDS